MLIGFIGSPCSGKTTTAAKLFAELKDMGLPTDFITEKARSYIAKTRYQQKKAGLGETVVLTDDDQMAIFRDQFSAEVQMDDPRTIVITDASVLNTLMYMSEDSRNNASVQRAVTHILQQYSLLFVCSPVQRPDGVDINRVHDAKASEEIHGRIGTVIMPLLTGKNVIQLAGPSRTRHQEALSAVLDAYNATR